MKKNLPTPMADELLDFASQLPEAQTNDFFYTRLVGRMQQALPSGKQAMNLRPAILAGALALLLCANGLFIASQQRSQKESSSSASSLQSFASSYDLTVSTPF